MMQNSFGNVSIINANLPSVDVAAAAGRISTTFGTAEEILEKSRGNAGNLQLISKVLGSGHKSIIEHMTFNLVFNNVSVFVEQFIIEFRLASYTVQSRRYVDFSNVGYYIPNKLSFDVELLYKDNMDNLFNNYVKLLDLGIPKEDARFVLPYCFRSNFYCTCNARELIHIICNMIYGRGSIYEEILTLGKSLKEQFDTILPNIIDKESDRYALDATRFKSPNLIEVEYPVSSSSEVELLSSTSMDLKNISKFTQMNFGVCNCTDFEQALQSTRARELEMLTYVFEIKNISMAGLTHLTRHRIQSLIVPNPINALTLNKFVMPDSIKNSPDASKVYVDSFEKNYSCVKKLINLSIDTNNLVYFVLSGNTLDVISSMNAREFNQFAKLRTCNRAQWEIRKIATKMLNIVRSDFFDVFKAFGPSCFVSGKCPEGRMSCGKIEEMKKKFEERIIDED